MNDAMPQWRTFSSEPPAPHGPPAPPPHGPPAPPTAVLPPRPALARLDATTASLIGLGAAGLAGALVVVITLFGGMAPASDIFADTGEPLGDTAALGDTSPRREVDSAGLAETEDIVVDVAGAVARPGLHRLSPGARIGDAITAAGGFAPRVDLAEVGRSINLAQPLSDGTKVHVPELGFDQLDPAPAADGRIDLNGADQALLETLPGIGPVTAAKIIEARTSSRFDAVSDLRERGLVGESVFEQIKDQVHAGS